jgi:hypothetical protein
MSKMYPIIRRQRRPFVVEPLPPAKVELPKFLPDGPRAKPMDKPKSNAGKNVSQPKTK